MKTLIIYMAILFCISAHSKQHDLAYTFSLDTGYSKPNYSNRAFWQFGIEFEYLGATIFDSAGSASFIGEHPLTRFLWTGLMGYAWEYPQFAFFVSNHELGHATRNLAIDGNPIFAWSAQGAKNHDGIFPFFLEGFTRFNNGATTTTNTTTSIAVPTDWNEIVFLAGGVNNSGMFSEALEKEIYYNSGHINQLRAYERGKSDLYNYAFTTVVGSNSGDIDQLLTAYNTKGYNISKADLMQGSKNARLLSFTYWAYWWGIYNYISEGDPTVKPFELGGFKLPDLSHYLLRNGLSYKLSSGYRADGFIIPFSIESIYKGTPSQEISIGFRKPFKLSAQRNAGYEINIIYNENGSTGYELSSDYELSPAVLLSAGYNRYDTNTFMGERNAVALDNSGLFGEEFWLKTSWVF